MIFFCLNKQRYLCNSSLFCFLMIIVFTVAILYSIWMKWFKFHKKTNNEKHCKDIIYKTLFWIKDHLFIRYVGFALFVDYIFCFQALRHLVVDLRTELQRNEKPNSSDRRKRQTNQVITSEKQCFFLDILNTVNFL